LKYCINAEHPAILLFKQSCRVFLWKKERENMAIKPKKKAYKRILYAYLKGFTDLSGVTVFA